MFELTSRPGGLAGILQDGPREVLFSIDDTEYTIPVEFPPTAAMLYANVLGTGGAEYATTWAMQLALGVDGFAALCAVDVPKEEFVKMLAVVIGKIQGFTISAPGATDPKPTAAKRRKR